MPSLQGHPDVSFIWVCGSGASDINSTLRCYLAAIGRLQRSFELVIVCNGPGSEVVSQVTSLLRASRISATIVTLNHISPESAALRAGFRQTTGTWITVLPAYPQSDPDDIPHMLQAAEDGLDYVAAWRTPRVDSRAEQSKSRLFNWIVRTFSRVPLHDINSGLRLMHREVLETVPLYGDLQVFLPILAAHEGFRVGEVPVRHLEERIRRTDRGLGVYLRRGLDLLTLFFLHRFTQRPFRFFGSIGTGMIGAGGLIVLILGIQRILGQSLADRPMLVLGTLLIVLGIQTFSLGLIGELIIFSSAGGLKDYQVEDVLEISADNVEIPHEEVHSNVNRASL